MRYPCLIGAGLLVAMPAFAQDAPAPVPPAAQPSIGDSNRDSGNQNGRVAHPAYDNPLSQQAQNDPAPYGVDNRSWAERNIPADRENGANVNGEPSSPADASSPNR
jgi:hypothetical protein